MFRDFYEKFKKVGVEVIGISGDDFVFYKVYLKKKSFDFWI